MGEADKCPWTCLAEIQRFGLSGHRARSSRHAVLEKQAGSCFQDYVQGGCSLVPFGGPGPASTCRGTCAGVCGSVRVCAGVCGGSVRKCAEVCGCVRVCAGCVRKCAGVRGACADVCGCVRGVRACVRVRALRADVCGSARRVRKCAGACGCVRVCERRCAVAVRQCGTTCGHTLRTRENHACPSDQCFFLVESEIRSKSLQKPPKAGGKAS